jgi:hypothetical protein
VFDSSCSPHPLPLPYPSSLPNCSLPRHLASIAPSSLVSSFVVASPLMSSHILDEQPELEVDEPDDIETEPDAAGLHDVDVAVEVASPSRSAAASSSSSRAAAPSYDPSRREPELADPSMHHGPELPFGARAARQPSSTGRDPASAFIAAAAVPMPVYDPSTMHDATVDPVADPEAAAAAAVASASAAAAAGAPLPRLRRTPLPPYPEYQTYGQNKAVGIKGKAFWAGLKVFGG